MRASPARSQMCASCALMRATPVPIKTTRAVNESEEFLLSSHFWHSIPAPLGVRHTFEVRRAPVRSAQHERIDVHSRNQVPSLEHSPHHLTRSTQARRQSSIFHLLSNIEQAATAAAVVILRIGLQSARSRATSPALHRTYRFRSLPAPSLGDSPRVVGKNASGSYEGDLWNVSRRS